MNVHLKAAARWGLVLATFVTTTFISFASLMGFMAWPDRSLVALLGGFGVCPRATLDALHRLEIFLAISIWVIPPACAIGFAVRKSQGVAMRVGTAFAIFLFAIVSFVLSRRDKLFDSEWVAVVAAIILLGVFVVSIRRSCRPRLLISANLLAALLLFGPAAIALSHRVEAASQAKLVWSNVLQQDQWQAMNTGSEYGATRQLAFVGGRVIAVFDAGFPPSRSNKDKWPVTTYKLVSLDLATGAKLKEITIPGPWGTMPYIYPTQEGFLDVQSNPERIVDQDLETVMRGSAAPRNRNAMECGSANCDPLRFILGENTLQLRQGHFQVFDGAGKLLSGGNIVDWGNFAGSSADGKRFAIQSSYGEGDPNYVVYEYFTIYDATNGNVLSSIHMKDLPDRQSWSAFSPDGRYFAAGNPNKLTLYKLP